MSPISHYTVLVIGEDVEEQLRPYDEGIQVAPYRKYDADPAWLFRFHEEEMTDEGEWQQPTPEQLVAWLNDRWEDEKYGVDEMGIYSLSTYSQNSKWDWYTVGGRWRGFFKLTPEAMDRATLSKVGDPGVFDNEPTFDADVVFRGDVDADAMRGISGEAAGDRWDRAHALFAGTPEPDSWATVLERHPEDTDAGRAEYREQPRIKACNEHDEACRKEERWADALLGWTENIETYDVSREEFVRRARDNAVCPYAYLRDGEWFSPGEMGWWGMSSDTDEDQGRFAREFNEMFDALPDDTTLTMCDLHI